jgi:hypothetical protein
VDQNPYQFFDTAVSKKERPMTEQKNQLASLFAACWKDEALKARFMSDPKAVLSEYDMDVPDGMDVKVVENADNCVHITMPATPTGSMELSDEELANAAGGYFTITVTTHRLTGDLPTAPNLCTTTTGLG